MRSLGEKYTTLIKETPKHCLNGFFLQIRANKDTLYGMIVLFPLCFKLFFPYDLCKKESTLLFQREALQIR